MWNKHDWQLDRIETDVVVIERKLDRVLMLLGAVLLGERYIMAALDDLTVSVHNTSGVIDSAIVAFKGISERLAVAIAAADPAALVALKDELDAKAAALAAAVDFPGVV